MRQALSLLFAFAGCLTAQTAVTEPLGLNKITCLTNSDTIVGVPFRQQGSQTSTLASAPVVNGDVATLTLSLDSLNASGLTKHFVKFNSGTKNGCFYDITANTANTLTIALNGDALTGAVSGNSVVISEFWTLDTLFPPAGVTTLWTETPTGSGNWVPNGNAIVASASTLATARRTEVLIPDVVSSGTNLPAEGRYYVSGGTWKRSNSGTTNYGNIVKLYPDTLFTISQPSTVARSTIFRSIGEVELGSMVIPLSTRDNLAQDNFIAIPRPLSVTLEGLNLRQSGAFMTSASTLTTARRDQLLVFNNDLQLKNKTPSATYYVSGGTWKLVNGGTADQGTVSIPAASGFIVRKYQVAGHPTAFWTNTPTY